MMWTTPHYNIPSNNRELQRTLKTTRRDTNYNIPSNNRELQQAEGEGGAG